MTGRSEGILIPSSMIALGLMFLLAASLALVGSRAVSTGLDTGTVVSDTSSPVSGQLTHRQAPYLGCPANSLVFFDVSTGGIVICVGTGPNPVPCPEPAGGISVTVLSEGVLLQACAAAA